jgi:hypothetical protein
MGTSLEDMLARRPVDREAVDEHKRRMREDGRPSARQTEPSGACARLEPGVGLQ